MSARLPADVIAAALVASYRFDGKDPRALLGPNPSVTLLADAALVIKEGFDLRDVKAAQLCCLSRPAKLVATKMSSHFACDKRDRRQAAIKAALGYALLPSSPLLPVPPVQVQVAHVSRPDAGAIARELKALGLPKTAKKDGLGTGPVVIAPPVEPKVLTVTVPARQFGATEAARLARQQSMAVSPVLDADGLPPIPPIVCGAKWSRDYINERERIKALHRAAGRKVPQ